MKIEMPLIVKKIINKIHTNGYEGYIVGGCVRDSLLGRSPEDWDITTNATPDEIINIFKEFNLLTIGIKHGTITIVMENQCYEITTFRIDGEYLDHRRPNSVEFTKDLIKDLSRRDFTINAMAYNHENQLIDPFDGKSDLKNRIVTCVGEPDKRFNEDALRMLRGVRFSTQLNFDIEHGTMVSIKNNSVKLTSISKERIRDELNKILLSNTPSLGIEMLIESNLMDSIIPEIKDSISFDQRNKNHDKDVCKHTMCVLDNTESDLILRLSALLHDIGKPKCFTVDEGGNGHFYNHHIIGAEMAAEILKRLKYDNSTIDSVCRIIKEHMIRFNDISVKGLKRLVGRVGLNNYERLIKLLQADIIGSRPPHDYSSIQQLNDMWNTIISEKHPLNAKDLDINGRDLIDLGIPQGKEIGIILDDLLDKVLENPSLNEREMLKREALSIIRSKK